MKKICVVTGTRAEYGLLYWFMKGIQGDPQMELQIVATGMHLSPEFGLTYKNIEKDGFYINRKVEMLLSADTPSAISKSTGLGIIGFADVFSDLEPDIIVVLGDRFEILAASIAATFSRTPIAHFHGGEATEGLIDEAIRHSITKMSHLHFVAAEEYKKRVIQMGESPDKVFLVGGMGIDNIKKLPLYSKRELENQINFKFGLKNLLITLHPVTLERDTARGHFINLLQVLDEIEDTKFIFTKPNADTEGRQIIHLIDEFVNQNPDRSIAFVSMGQLKYLSALQYIDALVGNSSSGFAEAPTFKIGTINIGDRQRGRLKADSIIGCEPTKKDIKAAIQKLYSPQFQQKLKTVKSPYGDGGASKKALDIIRSVEVKGLLKKRFYNILEEK
ncbi:MAG: UDP-N-acetylglucosamine 2-epimerase (hydrolyzing) [Candidatus Marinimicrobia bacterium]|jgi:GDP/UDP-N,N'-diacetylbacillosamine 2-epimerase (hydrolysing)|nr:UDP-N-acetylglucosamine 2-epimerase (hydrolyzing) [Candidatus Neomarinimicrobiota bacterium]